MKKKVQIIVLSGLSAIFIAMSLFQMDVFPNKFERIILGISFKGTINEISVKNLHRVVTLDDETEIYMPRTSNFRILNNSLKGNTIVKKKE